MYKNSKNVSLFINDTFLILRSFTRVTEGLPRFEYLNNFFCR